MNEKLVSRSKDTRKAYSEASRLGKQRKVLLGKICLHLNTQRALTAAQKCFSTFYGERK